jgi:hypothetical protein
MSASGDVEKLAVFDNRIVQSPPRYAVDKGALSVTNAPFQALSQSSSQHTYSVQVPSENIFVSRNVNWTSQVGLAITFAATFVAGATYTIAPFGKSWSYSAFPLHTLTNTLQATINDSTVVINTADVLKELLRLVDFRKNRLQRTCPTKLDQTAITTNDQFVQATTYGPYSSGASTRDELPNGNYYHSSTPLGAISPYVSSTGGVLAAGALTATTGYTFLGTAPTSLTLNTDGSLTLVCAGGGAPSSITLFIAPTFTENLVLPPFIFSDVHEADTGLFGIQNMTFVMNMRNPQDGRVIRQVATQATNATPANSVNMTVTSAYVPTMFSSSGGTFTGSRLDVTFLTPSLDLPLPAKSVIPYSEFPRYITTTQTAVAANTTGNIQSQTITLPQIPDLLIIYAKPNSYADSTNGDWYLPIKQINLQWDNYAGLLSTYSMEQLYEISVKNGLEMDYPQWCGRLGMGGVSGNSVMQASGGFLVIKPGQDYALATGQSPSLVGNYTLQANLTVMNTTGASITPTLYIMTVNSGFFESVKGTSRVVKGVLTEADIISAPIADMVTRQNVERVVGGSGVLAKIGHFITRVPHYAQKGYEYAKQASAVIKPHLAPEHQAALSAVGLGSHSGGMSSGGRRGEKKLSERLR